MNDQSVNGLLMTDQSDGIAASLQAVLDGTKGFVETPTAKYINLALERAYNTSTMTAIAGVPGVLSHPLIFEKINEISKLGDSGNSCNPLIILSFSKMRG